MAVVSLFCGKSSVRDHRGTYSLQTGVFPMLLPCCLIPCCRMVPTGSIKTARVFLDCCPVRLI